MRTRRRVAVAVGAPVAPLPIACVPAAPVGTHGRVTLPASRQERYAEGIVPGGRIGHEPRGAEGLESPPGRSSGHAEYAELGDSTPSQVTSVVWSVTHTWRETARQATGNGQVFIGVRKIGECTGTHTRPAVDVAPVGFGGVTGQWCVRDNLGACPA
ncbi:chitin-binding protein [Streptomyces sp. CSDS2]|uniref:chitin-binding protein n=1 Tax=Streptomyces sp. CSDS2 TaxID=3055051 RepID=UPI0025B1D48A|nr:chitin-binding protein [Streptomyces sp. CSDS2]MDN3263636.1 chitin-binding protein [Streptomyces sp. CSDS2]